MVSVGQTGQLGNEWAIQNARRNNIERLYGTQIDLYSNLIMTGVDEDVVLDRMELEIEGLDETDKGDLLNWDQSLWSAGSADDRVFENDKQNLFTHTDLRGGTYTVMDEQSFTEKLGMDWSGGKPYDVFEIQNNNINFYDFVFAGTEDGNQENVVFNLNDLTEARWGINKYTIREVDTDKLNAGVTDGDYENELANDTLRIIKNSIPQWMNANIANKLSQYEEGSDDYNKKFIELAIEMMDQEGYTKGNEIESPAEDELNKPEFVHHTVKMRNTHDDITNTKIGDYDVTLKGGSTRPQYTIKNANGEVVATIYQDELSKSGKSIEEFVKSL